MSLFGWSSMGSGQHFEKHLAIWHHGLSEIHCNFAHISFGSTLLRGFLEFEQHSDLLENRFLTPLQWLVSIQLLGFVEGNIGRQNSIHQRLDQGCYQISGQSCLQPHVRPHNHPWYRWPCRRAPFRFFSANSILGRTGRCWIISSRGNLV